MKFGVGIIPQDNTKKTIDLIKIAEDVGFEYAWIYHKTDLNLYSLLKTLSFETENIKIGPGVTNPYIKDVKNAAYEIININNLSDKRAVFGIGPGDRKIMEQLNKPWTNPTSTLKNYIDNLHESFKKKNSNIPIYIEAQSPKLLETSGQIANGCLINASHPKDFKELSKHVETGRNASNNKGDFDIAAYAATSIGEDTITAKNAAKIVVAFIIAGSAPPVLERHNISQETRKKIYIQLSQGNIGKALGLIGDDLIDIFSITGTSKEIIPQIESLKEVNVTQFVVSAPFGRNHEESLRLFKDVIDSF